MYSTPVDNIFNVKILYFHIFPTLPNLGTRPSPKLISIRDFASLPAIFFFFHKTFIFSPPFILSWIGLRGTSPMTSLTNHKIFQTAVFLRLWYLQYVTHFKNTYVHQNEIGNCE